MVRLFDVEMKTTSKDMGADAILRQISEVDGSYVTVGYHEPETTRFSTSRGKKVSDVPLGTYAYWNEYGNVKNNQPARPTLGPMFDARNSQYVKQTATHMRKMYRTPRLHTAKKILETQGKRAVGWLRIQIRTFSTPDTQESTKRWKKHKRRRQQPLQYTGTMLKSSTYRVKMNPKPNDRLRRMMAKAERQLMRVKL
jgi:hypothetical protein